MTNLLNNAAKYTPEGGKIEVKLEAEAEELVISVIDNGIGMSEDLIKNAFDLFSQGQRSLDRSQGGLDIGLALVRSLLNLHDGSISAHSEGLGMGATFVVRLPHLTRQAALPMDPHMEQRAGSAAPLRIAIVDDNEDAAVTLSIFLQAFGHEVFVMHAAPEALEKLPALAPDVCLLDIGLPELDGFALARRLRQIPATARASLFAVTGYGQEKDRQEAVTAGFDALFPKPVDLGMLNKALAQMSSHKSRFLGSST